ncbi:MAG: hypothetical protein FWE77_00815 [Clostridia bacterium]|nr:hypothetical protein [Clostridia bacterium]
MATSPAVCPLCARVHEIDLQELPESLCCESCGAMLVPRAHGAAVMLVELKAGPPPEKPEVEALLERAANERKPYRAHPLILQALEMAPDSFAANRALLYHGRLYEAIKRPGDYSLIKCFLMNIFEDPKSYTAEEMDGRVKELFYDPQLARTAALSGDEAAFLREYLRHLAREYITLFVRGRSSVSRSAFGFGRSADSVRQRCGQIVDLMQHNLRAEPRLTEEQRELISEALALEMKEL